MTETRSKKIAMVQAQLDKKTGAASGNPDNVPTATNSDAKPKKKTGWFMENLWTILLLIASIAVFYFGVYHSSWKSPHIAHIGTWAYGHWFCILVLCGIAEILIKINEKSLAKAAGILQNILLAIIFMLFIGFPIIGWFVGIGNQGKQPKKVSLSEQVRIPLASAPISEWPKLVIPAGGKVYIPIKQGMQIIVKGHNADLLHTVYLDGHECVIPIESNGSNPNGPITAVYVTNETKEMNDISYAYSK